ncbi:MAG: methyltransferase [Anaerolineales bacterium]|jgi:protein-S-isoprenylcysteine O-methyltransferase Ste14
MNKIKVLPPTYFYLSLIAMIVLHYLFPVMRIIPSPWNAIGVIFLVAGIVLSLIGDHVFHQAGTTIKPFEESANLVTEGVFRLSRNPMYLGFVLLLAGAGYKNCNRSLLLPLI